MSDHEAGNVSDAAEPRRESTSELGSNRATPQPQLPSLNADSWQALLEVQNRSMMQLIEAMRPPPCPPVLSLPEFNPDVGDAGPRAWCSTVDICLTERPLEGGALIIALSKALKGTASTWLSQVSHVGMTWPYFKDLFIRRNNVIILDRNKLLQEMKSLIWLKRKHTEDHHGTTDVKRFKGTQPNQFLCNHCKKPGHKAIDCRLRNARINSIHHNTSQSNSTRGDKPMTLTTASTSTPPAFSFKKPITCFRCGEKGHIASQCSRPEKSAAAGAHGASGSGPSTVPQRRVNSCEVRPWTTTTIR